MPTGTIRKGRPRGTHTYEQAPAQALGRAVRAARVEQGVAQESLAYLAGVERSHMGKIERGEHIPTLVLILRIAAALNTSAASLIAAMEADLAQQSRAGSAEERK